MVDKVKIANSLYGLVGLDNPTNPSYVIVDAENQESRSGLKATDNSHVKIEFLKDTYDYVDVSDSDFNAYLKKLQTKSILDVVNKVQIKPSYIDRQLLYKYTNNKVNTIDLNANSFVGYHIIKSGYNNIAFNITQVYLEFEGTGDVEIVLFNSSIKTPIYSKVVSVTSSNQLEPLNWVVDNTQGSYEGEFYLGYFTNSTTLKPYKRDYQRSDIVSVIKQLCVNQVEFSNVVDGELFDLTTKNGASQGIGCNFDITTYKDYTDLFIQNEQLFAEAINKQFIINCIETYLTSLRSNRVELISSDMMNRLIAVVEGVEGKMQGLKPTLDGILVTLNSDINKLINGYFITGLKINRQ